MIKTIVLNCLLIIGFNADAQTKDESAVATATEKFRVAMIDADQKALQELVSDQLSYGHSSGRVEGKKEFIENIVSGKSDFITMDLSEQTISVNGSTAIVRNTLKGQINDNGKPGEVNLKVMLVWHKQGSKWILLARQAVKIAV